MKDGNYRNITTVKVDIETKDFLKKLKREMERQEDKDLSMGEVIKRAVKNSEIPPRLLMGSKERRLGLR